MRTARVLLAIVGIAVAAYGATLLLDLGTGNLRATVVWLIGGIVLHDAVLAPLTVLLGAGFVTLQKAGVRTGPLIIAGLVLGTVTIAAIPVLGRFGARADNATLLDRNYLAGWLVLAGLTTLTVVLLLVRGRRRPWRGSRTRSSGTSAASRSGSRRGRPRRSPAPGRP
jgi:hypothetical protein